LEFWAQKVDYIRPRILYKFGGVFVDADVIMFQTPVRYFEIMATVNQNATLLGEGVENMKDMSVGFLAAKPNCPILKHWMSLQDEALEGKNVVWETLGRTTLNCALPSGIAVYLNRDEYRPFPWNQCPSMDRLHLTNFSNPYYLALVLVAIVAIV
jgi:mannosyltransferase OCH1-like enzyme